MTTELTRLVLGMNSIQAHTTAVRKTAASAERAAIVGVQANGEGTDPVESTPGQLAFVADGAIVRHTDGWHEVKAGVIQGAHDRNITPANHCAARESVTAFSPRLVIEEPRRCWGSLPRPNLAILRLVHIVADGVSWTWNLTSDHFGEQIEVVDFPPTRLPLETRAPS